ncbi:MAG: LysR family transcriptional regulator [Victivallaceae bacterium]
MIDNKIKIFTTLCELKSFSQTASFLKMSQPNVSQQIRKLEQELGFQLLVRDTKNLLFTREGRAFEAAAQKLLNVEKMVNFQIMDLRGGKKNYLLGGTLTAGNFVLPDLLAKYMLLHPNVNLHLKLGNTAEMVEKLQQQQLDLALVEGPFDSKSFISVKYCSDELRLTGNPTKIPDSNPQSLTALIERGEKFLLRESGSGTRYHFDRFCADCRLQIPEQNILVVESFEAIKRLTANGVGWSVLSPLSCQDELQLRRLKQCDLTEGRISRDLNFIFQPGENLQFAQRFCSFACHHFHSSTTPETL